MDYKKCTGLSKERHTPMQDAAATAKPDVLRLEVISSDEFLRMPTAAQALYFHLGTRADKNGHVTELFSIMQRLGSKTKDYDILVRHGYIDPVTGSIRLD